MVELERQNIKENTKIYNNVCKSIRKALGANVLINHVGSTSIPNMYGKNIIDILVGVKNEYEMEEFTLKLKEIGYFPGKNSNGLVYRFLANRKEETRKGDIHIHLVLTDSDRYRDFLILKKYLLDNKEERKNYSNFKKEIIKSGNFMREDYKKIKSEYVSNLLNRARDNITL